MNNPHIALDKIEQIPEAFFARSERPHLVPELAYHQTNSKGLREILKSKSLWATRLTGLVDQDELSTLPLLFDDLKRCRESPLWQAPPGFEDLVWERLRDILKDIRVRPYVTCFCAPNQWACGVAPRWLGCKHYALEVSGPEFIEASRCGAVPAGQAFIEVCYDPAEQKRQIEEEIRYVSETVLGDLRRNKGYTREKAACDAASVLARPVFYHKTQAYCSESEWRTGIGLRDDPGLTNYLKMEADSRCAHVELPLPLGVLKSVYRRPGAALSHPQVEELLQSCGWAGVSVFDSEELPFTNH